MIRQSQRNLAALTRIEVVFIVAAIGAIVVIALSFQFRTKSKGQQATCTQNMKDILMGFSLWMSDHEIKGFPWMVDITNGGNLGLDRALTSQSWFQFSWISNELASPKALADPADKRKGFRVATSWGSDPNGGLSSQGFRNNACSYALGIDVGTVSSGPPRVPFDEPIDPVLVLDRHVSNNGRSRYCTFVTNVTVLNEPFNVKWGKEVHGETGGNLGFLSGEVKYLTSSQLTNRFYYNLDYEARALDRNLTVDEAHFLFPN